MSREISHLRSKNVSSGRQRLGELKQILENCKNSSIDDPRKILEATMNLKKAYVQEESFWKQKSRNIWLLEGDVNTKFFHAQTQQRRARNKMRLF